MATLFDLAQAYLNQGLPGINPIFSNTGVASVIPTTTTLTEEVVQPTSVGLTPEQLRLLYPQREGDGAGTGFGPTGDLDPTDTKDFFIDGEIVTGYRNVRSGLYQDEDGLNIQNLGIRGIPGATGILDSLKTDKTPKYPGYFDFYSAGDLFTRPSTFFSFFKDQTPTGADIARYRGAQKKTMREARDITEKFKKRFKPTARDLARGRTGGGQNFGSKTEGSVSKDGTDDTPGTPF